MTSISENAPITIRRLRMPRLRFARLAIGAYFNAIFCLVGDAFVMAYVGVSRSARPVQTVAEDLEGRDPSW
jgi:hypothetical protein